MKKNKLTAIFIILCFSTFLFFYDRYDVKKKYRPIKESIESFIEVEFSNCIVKHINYRKSLAGADYKMVQISCDERYYPFLFEDDDNDEYIDSIKKGDVLSKNKDSRLLTNDSTDTTYKIIDPEIYTDIRETWLVWVVALWLILGIVITKDFK